MALLIGLQTKHAARKQERNVIGRGLDQEERMVTMETSGPSAAAGTASSAPTRMSERRRLETALPVWAGSLAAGACRPAAAVPASASESPSLLRLKGLHWPDILSLSSIEAVHP